MKLETLKTIESTLNDAIVAEEAKIRNWRAQIEIELRDALRNPEIGRGKEIPIRPYSNGRLDVGAAFRILEGINMNLSALITIKRLLEMAIEQAKTELETSKKRYDSLKNLSKMTEDDTAKAAIATQMSAADELTSVLWRWKLDLENAWEAFTEKDWR